MDKRVKDITGNRYGWLTVLHFVERPRDAAGRDSFWMCQCDCGKQKAIRATNLKSGNVRSCGCGERVRSENPFKERQSVRSVIYILQKNLSQPVPDHGLFTDFPGGSRTCAKGASNQPFKETGAKHGTDQRAV